MEEQVRNVAPDESNRALASVSIHSADFRDSQDLCADPLDTTHQHGPEHRMAAPLESEVDNVANRPHGGLPIPIGFIVLSCPAIHRLREYGINGDKLESRRAATCGPTVTTRTVSSSRIL